MIVYNLLADTGNADARAVRPHFTLRQAANALKIDSIGALAVTNDDGILIGVLTERAILQALADKGQNVLEQPISSIMTLASVTCVPEDEIGEVLTMMSEYQVSYVPVLDEARVLGLVGIIELIQATDMHGFPMDKDPLTSLPSRNYFVDRLVKEIERSNRYRRALSVARIDIDKFGPIVSEYGDYAGDIIAKALAELFFDEIRNVDFVGRVGNEAFAIYFPETDLRGAEVACKRLIERVRAKKIDIGPRKIRITVSIGLTQLSTKTTYSLGILNRADELLGQAKANGEDCVQTDPALSKFKPHHAA